MKRFLVLLLLIKCSLALGAEIEIIGPCDREPVFVDTLEAASNDNVGSFSVRFFDYYEIEYIGSERGMNSILGTATGMDALEIISDQEMMAYGWCYSINGESPEVYPDQVSLTDKDKVIWWYGYAHYLAGEWITQCTPSYERQSDSICK
ncbi:MAG: hypothetical protein CME60_05055 [Halobacteriovoraceae bacterium]|nr:hypothetical protein [Halobacteriovoraceae bacterium]|tara:strand:+ start:982 stop:1428 length:447 start_codon:yes stop_codon:yes gene_type:complete